MMLALFQALLSSVTLDGKPAKTPLQRLLVLKAQALADGIVAEWAAQGEEVIPQTMSLTRLAMTMIDKVTGGERAALEAELLKYGSSDLICYFAPQPPKLTARQEALWRPLHGWLKARHDISFETVFGIQYCAQPLPALENLAAALSALDAAAFTAVQAIAPPLGSIAIALALMDENISPEEAYQAACVDEIFQLETWGEDAEARKRLAETAADLAAVMNFYTLSRA